MAFSLSALNTYSISTYVLAFRLHSLQFNVTRFHLINTKLFVHRKLSHHYTRAKNTIMQQISVQQRNIANRQKHKNHTKNGFELGL